MSQLIPLVDEPIFPSSVQALHSHGAASRARLIIKSTGHRVLYDEHGYRILYRDPSGIILHECEWIRGVDGSARLAHARVRPDSLLWIGLIPEATTHETRLDLSIRPDWRSITNEHLREMAARAWKVPLDDVRYFFPDKSFEWTRSDEVIIRLKKDGLFLLEDGTFAQPRFISYMGAIPWTRIDLLNVVELFQSTLPGTGSAVFELIWGLCDDQRPHRGSIPLRYRGLPTYPSAQASGLFSACFRPEIPNGEDPQKLFMDPQRTNQIRWWPRQDPPCRYFDRLRQLAVTVQGGIVQKVMVINDPVGVPYVAPGTRGGFAPCARTVVVQGGQMQLRDDAHVQVRSLDPAWSVIHETPTAPVSGYPFGWRAFFSTSSPQVNPARVHALSLFYPDDESEVAE